MLFWVRDLWFKYYFDAEKTSYFTAGFFPYSIGHGIALGNGYRVGQPLSGNYTFEDVDQFRPGMLLSGAFNDNRCLCNLYFGTISTYSDNIFSTGAFSNAQNFEQQLDVTRGAFKSNYVVAGQFKCIPKTS